jgi:hypothetical protein
MAKTIFKRGVPWFGRIWTEAFFQRADNVVATVRNPGILTQLISIKSTGSKLSLMDLENLPMLLLEKNCLLLVKQP